MLSAHDLMSARRGGEEDESENTGVIRTEANRIRTDKGSDISDIIFMFTSDFHPLGWKQIAFVWIWIRMSRISVFQFPSCFHPWTGVIRLFKLT